MLQDTASTIDNTSKKSVKTASLSYSLSTKTAHLTLRNPVLPTYSATSSDALYLASLIRQQNRLNKI